MAVGDLQSLPHDTLCLQKLALTSPTSGGRSVGIVRSWTQATEFFVLFFGSATFTVKAAEPPPSFMPLSVFNY
jgi:hypothetical protein